MVRNIVRTTFAVAAICFGYSAFAGSAQKVNSAAELQTALANATPGAVFELAPGDYAAPEIKPTKLRPIGSTPITLRSADPTHPAIFSGLMVKAGHDIIFEGLRFDYRFGPGDAELNKIGVNWPIQILGASGITIQACVFDGDLATAGAPEDIGFPTATALVVRYSSNITLEGNEFVSWYRGLGIDNSQSIIIRGNNFHSMRMDGMNLAALQSVLIEKNHIHDFNRSLASKDHADMIQFWTAGTKKPSTDITIRDNVLNSGNGAYTQSIFMRNEVVDQNKAGREMFYRNVKIEQNIIINAHLHGISLGAADGVVIRNNTLIRNRRSDGAGINDDLWTPRIRIEPTAENVDISDNITSAIDGPTARPDWRVSGNLLIQDRNPNLPGWYDTIFAAARSGDPGTLAAFVYLPDGLAAQNHLGADGLRLDHIGGPVGEATKPVALMQLVRDEHYLNRYNFDASLSVIPKDAQAEYLWDFDGISAIGRQVGHDFSKPGPHQIRLQVRLASGESAEAAARVDIASPEVLRLDTTRGQFLTRQGDKDLALPDIPLSSGASLILGQGHPALAIDRAAIAGVFSAQDLDLRLRLRTAKTSDPTGEILRVHNFMVLQMTPIGGVEFQLMPEGAVKPVVIRTGPLHLHDGAWHDLAVIYSANSGQITLLVDGTERAKVRAKGKLGHVQRWGLSFGNPFGQKSLDGEIATFDLRSNVTSFAP